MTWKGASPVQGGVTRRVFTSSGIPLSELIVISSSTKACAERTRIALSSIRLCGH